MNKLTLDEASGPVSPKFQYSFVIAFADDGDAVSLTIHSKKGALGTHDVKASVSREAFAALLAAVERTSDLVDDARANRVGVRVNTLVVTRGDVESVVRYTGSDVDPRVSADDKTNSLRAARDAILALVRDALPTAT